MESVGEFEYNTKDLIGHGAFAVVFKGRHKTNRDLVVAIKSITKKNLAKSQNLLGKEIKILKELTELHHENVVALLDCKETPHHVYLVMEYCNGGDLADYLHAKGTLSEDTIRRFLRQIAGAMKALNAKGIVHRDLKPQNILLCHSGKPNPSPGDITLKIADFGFARSLQEGVMAATLCGSPMYMAPEVIMSMKYDAKADLWSIGTIVFQCLTGKAPFQATTPQALKQFYEKTANLIPKIPSGTSADLSDLLMRLLKRDAKDRMEFDEFFTHPFLKSSPVPVPHKRRSLSPDLPPMAQSPTYTSPSQTWGSEMGGEEPAQDVGLGTSPPVEMRISPLGKRESLSSPEDQDYVIVPSNIPDDPFGDRTKGQNPNWQSGNMSSSPSRNPFGTSPPPLQKLQSGVNINPATCGVTYRATNTSPVDSSRPGFLPVSSSPRGSPSSGKGLSQVGPVPVPSQREAYEQIQRSLRDSSSASASASSESLDKMSGRSVEAPLSLTSPPRSPKALRTDMVIQRQDSFSSQGSDHGKIATDISSLSPPTVQFTVGTPPGGGRRRSYSGGTPPPHTGRQTPPTFRQFTPPTAATILAGSPLRRSSGPFFSNFPVFGNANYLPPILGSPTKEFTRADQPLWGCRCQTEPCLSALKSYDAFGNYNPASPLRGAFASRALTLPEINAKDPWPANKKETPEQYDSGLQRSGSFGRLAEHGLYRSPQGACSTLACHNAHPNVLMQLGHQTAHQHYQYWIGNPRECQGSPGRARHNSTGGIGTCIESSPPPSGASFLPSSTSPPTMEPIVFVPPELPEETLLGKEHNETLAKLNFVLTLVDCILDLARSRSTPITSITESYSCKESQTEQISVMSDGYRRAEQLVLYMRALRLLSSSLQLSRQEVQANRLQPSSVVRNLLQKLKERFHYCMNMCKTLNTPGVLQSAGVDTNNSSVTADRLIYNYAIEMCQSAALEELFGNPHECSKRYQTAQILLHSLSQQISSDEDRKLLSKYKEAVEKRLIVLHKQGYVYLYT